MSLVVELNPAKEGLRFPTQTQVEKIMTELQTADDKRTDVSSYQLQKRFFPAKNILSLELEMFIVRNHFDNGMMYPHALSTEPRTVARDDKLSLEKTSFSGAYFKEAVRWGEEEILKLSSMAPGLRPVTIQSEVAESLVALRNRRLRRIEALCAEVLTTGQIVINKNTPENPEGVTYTVDYLIDTPEMTIPYLWDATEVNGDGQTVSRFNIIKYWHDYRKSVRDAEGRYMPEEILVGPEFVDVIRNNTFFWDTFYAYNTTVTETNQERRPQYFYGDEFILDWFKRLTGMQVTIIEEGYYTPAREYKRYIPRGTMIVLFGGGTGKFGEFTFTAHAHSENGSIRLGTGPYLMVNSSLHKANPYYEIFHGFHGLPRLLDYDPADGKFHRFKRMSYASPTP